MGIKFSEIKNGEVILFVIGAKNYLQSCIEILKHYCNTEKSSCVYVTVNKPYSTLLKVLKDNKVDSEKVFVIDAITPLASRPAKIENAVFIGSPSGITDISISATTALKNLPSGKRLLFFDSLSTLLVYNDVGSVTKFSHFLINKMKEWGISGAIITLEKETDEKLLSQLSQFVDRVVEVK